MLQTACQDGNKGSFGAKCVKYAAEKSRLSGLIITLGTRTKNKRGNLNKIVL